MRGLKLSWRPGEQEVHQSAVWNQISHSWAAGNHLIGLKQQRPEAQRKSIDLYTTAPVHIKIISHDTKGGVDQIL